MHWLARWLRWSYPDDRLALLARQAVAADPRLVNLTQMSITCTHGVIRLTGRVPYAWDRARALRPTSTAPCTGRISPIDALSISSTCASPALRRQRLSTQCDAVRQAMSERKESPAIMDPWRPDREGGV